MTVLNIKSFLIAAILLGGCFCLQARPNEIDSPVAPDQAEQVWKVKIEGNQTFSDIIIKEQIATEGFSFWEKLKFWNRSGHPLEEIEVKKDVIRIRNYYQRRGFPKVKVRYRIEQGKKPWKKHVIFTVNEQAPVQITDISYDFPSAEKYRDMIMKNSAFDRARRRSELKEGERYEPIKEPEVIAGYEQVLKNLGFAYTKVEIKAKVDTAKLAAQLTIDLDTGPMTYIDNITVEGDSTVDDAYIIRESALKKGRKYSLEALQDAQREIFNHHLFRFATINIPEQPQDSTLDLDMQVRENPLRSVRTSVGFGTEEYLRGQVSWTHRNVFRLGHQFSATAQASFIEQSINLDYLFPYAYNTKSSFIISPFGQHLLEPGYELYRLGITNSLIYRYSRNLTGSFSYQFTKNEELSRQQDVSLPDTTQSYDLSSLQFSGYYNQGFGRRGQQGWVIQPYAEVSGFLGTSTFQFQKISMDVRRYTPITGTTTLAMRVQAGKIFATREDSLPNIIRFFVGGTSSVRGWGRNDLGPKRVVTDSVGTGEGGVRPDTTGFGEYVPTGGRSFFAFNLEIRQDIDDLINNLGLAVFLDGGQVWRKDPDFEQRPLQFGLGGGVRYESPIGPVRLDIAYKLNPSDPDLKIYRGQNFGSAWDRIGIHVSIGQAF